MPIARFSGVLLCSSEDKNYPATNLTTNNSNKKWKCEEPGLDTAYVVLQFEKPTKISGIDIGNEHSAFIEVSVGRQGWPLDKYKTILVTSSFMTIPQSRVSESPNRVRCFGKDALMPDVAEEKWDMVKVTCTQGFNKHVQFGLSFITIHTPDAVTPSASQSSPVKPAVTASPKEKKTCDEALGLPENSAFAKFRMRVDSSDSDDKETDNGSTLFSKWKQEKDSVTTAAAIRDASSTMSKLEQFNDKIKHKVATPTGKTGHPLADAEKDSKKGRLDRYHPALLYDDDEDENDPKLKKLEKAINNDKERIEREQKELLDKKKPKKDTSLGDKSKTKMESSADKFQLFLQDNVPEQSSSSSAKTQDDNSTVEDESLSTPKVDKTISIDNSDEETQTPEKAAQASHSKSPDPPAWKVKRRSSTSHDNSASKRSRASVDSPANNAFDELLKGIVFVISGIQNPKRAEIREKGLKMGAKYKPDWDDTCTHLICAFKNTPKYKQVRGSGVIVNQEWICDCYDQKKKMKCEDYEL